MGVTAVGAELQTYALSNIQTIIQEYNSQMMTWKKYINNVADVQAAAADEAVKVLQKIEQERAEIAQLQFMALSLLGSAAISWIGAIAEIKLFPRFAGKKGFKEYMTFAGWRVKSVQEYSEVMAKTFGDTLHENVGHIFDHFVERLKPDEQAHEIDLDLGHAIENGDMGNYQHLLENALLDASKVILGQLAVFSTNLSKYRTAGGGGFGDEVRAAVLRQYPRPAHMRDGDYDNELLRRGQIIIDDYLDKHRRSWAKEWFYYGNNPVPTELPFLKFKLEIEIWAAFILKRDWKYKTTFTSTLNPRGPSHTTAFSNWVTDDEDEFKLDDIVDALKDLAEKELRSNLKLNPWRPGKTGTVRTIDPGADDDEAEAQEVRDVAKHGTDIDSGVTMTTVSERKEILENLKSWAKRHGQRRLLGHLDSRPRNIGTFAMPGSIFADQK